MTSHTPGPWTFYADSLPVDHKTYESPGYYDNLRLLGPDGEFIAGCDEYDVFSNNAADRALIAAAPELLEALKRLGSMEAFTSAPHLDPIRDAELLARIDYARAAIAKAEGRQ